MHVFNAEVSYVPTIYYMANMKLFIYIFLSTFHCLYSNRKSIFFRIDRCAINFIKCPRGTNRNLCTQKIRSFVTRRKIIWKCRTKIWPRKPTISFVFVCAYVIEKKSSHSLLQGYSILICYFFFMYKIFSYVVKKSYDDHLEDTRYFFFG